MMKLYGTSVISLRSGDVIDLEIADSEEAARALVEEQNDALENLGIRRRIEYRFAEIYINDK